MICLREEETRALSNLTFIDLFAGIGAFRLAFESFGAKCVFSSEWNKDVQDTYFKNYHVRPAGDITKIREEDIPHHDILCAGFPCQPFSISGKQLGFRDTRGTLFFEVARIIKYHKPKLVIIENVKNIMRHDNGRTCNVILSVLHELGYDVHVSVLNAVDYGVPQKRERAFFVCFDKKLGIENFNFPKPIFLEKHLVDVLLSDDLVSDVVVQRRDIVLKKDVVEKYCNFPLRMGFIGKARQGERIYSPFGVAITLSADGGGIGARTGLYLVNGKLRRLVPRECARIDGFPDSFILPESSNIAYRQLGNTVVVDVIQYVVRSILEVCSFL